MRTSPRRARRSELAKPPELIGVGLARRLAAGAVDAVLMIALFTGLVAASVALPSVAVVLRLLAAVFPTLLYFVILETYYQATLGKMVFDLRVVNLDGGRPDALAHLVRGMTRLPEAMMLMLPYLLVIPLSRRKQRLGDALTGTLVVRSSDRGAR
ncbi:MAG TPA: RDD family protein [Thermoleophilia bacterium]|nr:RDD family protein [Thermoleophilia bacterium]HQG04215.1 RDD family protein [Thermoleophilia bacterium]HQJ97781.1 RDD family protein [Thermoleophilia bacterium]